MTGWVVAAVALAAMAQAEAPVEVRAGARTWRMEPATLRLETVSAAGRTLLLSAGQTELGPATEVQRSAAGGTWRIAKPGARVELTVEGDVATVRVTLDQPGSITWPVISPDENVKALLLPRGEGIRISPDDERWAKTLSYDGSLTEEFSLPCWGLDLGAQTVSYLVPEPIGAAYAYRRRGGRLGFTVTRRFTRLEQARTWEVRVGFGPANPLAPALWYRDWLKNQGKFVSLADKIRDQPRTERLVGAIHAYLWGLCLNIEDVVSWPKFIRDLATLPDAEPGTPRGRVWAACPPAARKAIQNLVKEPNPYDFVEQEVTRAFSELLEKGILTPAQLVEAFPGRLTDPAGWGDAISAGFLDELRAAGIDRACLVLNDLSTGDSRPQVAEHADRLGYLYGPYDSYDGVHPPGLKHSWETSQFDAALYEHGGVRRENGAYVRGFKGVGRQLSPIAARPYMEKRVREKAAKVPFSAWFMDCDGAGMFYDDFSPEHPMSQTRECALRVDRMGWIGRTINGPIGTESGWAYTAGAFAFAHGTLTGAIGWQDKALTNEKSPYYLGGWWPPEAADVFFKPAPLMPWFAWEAYDPAVRIPLYEAALHDAVVGTHHWSTHSLKFKGTEAMMALLEQLYNVPPLYHFTRREFRKRRAGIVAHARFFSSLHRRLAHVALTGFEVLTPDRLVQRTRFADGTEITANFRDAAWEEGGTALPPRSVAARSGGTTAVYTPAYSFSP